MKEKQPQKSNNQTKVPTLDQVSAGGVAFRQNDSDFEIAVVSVKPSLRWQLPKGIVDEGETAEQTAVREVREEAGIETELLEKIETIEYWYYGNKNGERVRFHKFVHFFLMKYVAGETDNHDHEVAESRWVEIDEAIKILAFKSEKTTVEKAADLIKNLS